MKLHGAFSKCRGSFWILSLAMCWMFSPLKAEDKTPTTQKQIASVAQSIVDEIYDYDRQSQFEFVGETDGNTLKVTMYIEAETREHVGKVIYKYMPFGEVIRSYTLDSSTGLVTLYGDPSLKYPFPPTQPDTRTVFLDDAYVCKLKSTWRISAFVIDLKPTQAQLEDAARRQIKRVGYSFRVSSQRPAH